MLQRKCSCGHHTASGGECAECSKQKKLQKKLRIGAVNDPLEHEADRVADQVLQMPLNGETGKAPIKLQRLSHAGAGQESTVPDSVHQTLSGSGRPLDASLSREMGNSFGHDFSGVRVHQGDGAAQSARDVNAKAYTVGNNIVFGADEYAPSSQSGRHLIAHELAHVVQQTKSGNSLQRTALFSSTIDICHRLLKSRVFYVSQSSVEVAIDGRWNGPSEGGASCEGHRSSNYNVTLTQKNMFFDQEYGSCDFAPGELSTRSWSGLSPGNYYLVVWTNNTNPNCCLSGTIDVGESKKNGGDSCTVIPDDALQILHTALDLAGLIPVLGAIPDGLNAGFYAIEGDWVGAGISVAAMVPIFGEGVTVTKLGVKFTRKAIKKLGKEGFEAGFKAAKKERKAIVELTEEALEKEFSKGSKKTSSRLSKGKGSRKYEPPINDHGSGAGDLKLGGDISKSGKERIEAINSWSRDELEFTKEELEKSIAARKREQLRLGETSVGSSGQPIGAQHRLRIGDEEALLLAIVKKLSGK